jgi:hypothetical protein
MHSNVNACLSKIQNFSKIQPYHKFDNPNFDPERFKRDLEAGASPKLVALLKNIRKLDEEDMRVHKTHFKHYIFSDVKAHHGARILTSAFFAWGFRSAYKKDTLELDERVADDNTFAFLPGSACWQKEVPHTLSKDVTKEFNRVENKHGKYIRFIVLDSKYKEGIDLKDVKYGHLFDPLSSADEKQAIGRGARNCGQANIDFERDVGWTLYIFDYKLMLPTVVMEQYKLKGTDMFEILTETNPYTTEDEKAIFPKLMKELDYVGQTIAVDRLLTENIHPMKGGMTLRSGNVTKTNVVYVKKTRKKKEKVPDTQGSPVAAKGSPVATAKGSPVATAKGSPVATAKGSPVAAKGSPVAAKGSPAATAKGSPAATAKGSPAATAKGSPAATAKGSPAATAKGSPAATAKGSPVAAKGSSRETPQATPRETPQATPRETPMDDQVMREAEAERVETLIYLEEKYKHFPPTDLQRKVKKAYKTLAPYKIVNACATTIQQLPLLTLQELGALRTQLNVQLSDPRNTETELAALQTFSDALDRQILKANDEFGSLDDRPLPALSAAQQFVTEYVKPSMPTKGMLLWHSAGSGKTCGAVSMASTNFETAGYSIIWVTRASLKSEVQKNVFGEGKARDVICDHANRALIEQGEDPPRKYRPKWCGGPISYQTFSNFLNRLVDKHATASETFYNKYMTSVGEDVYNIRKADPLHKCLIVVDEAHKLYNGELASNEAPDLDILETMIHESYEKSQADSVRVVLMTATPYSYSPLEFFKLMNLLREDTLPTDLATLKRDLTADGRMKKELIQKFDGYISYVDVSKDRSRFAQVTRVVDDDLNVSMSAREPGFTEVTKEQVAAAAAAKNDPNDAETARLTAQLEQETADLERLQALTATFKEKKQEIGKKTKECVGKIKNGLTMTKEACNKRYKFLADVLAVSEKEHAADLAEKQEERKKTHKALDQYRKALQEKLKKTWKTLSETYKKQMSGPDESDKSQLSELRHCVNTHVHKLKNSMVSPRTLKRLKKFQHLRRHLTGRDKVNAQRGVNLILNKLKTNPYNLSDDDAMLAEEISKESSESSASNAPRLKF